MSAKRPRKPREARDPLVRVNLSMRASERDAATEAAERHRPARLTLSAFVREAIAEKIERERDA